MTSTTSNVSNQAGVSLLLAVLVLAAITAVAFSLATIVFIEIRSSGDLLRTEPALYATLGVTEEALFQYKRAVPETLLDVANCTMADDEDESVCRMPTTGVSLSFPGTQPIQYDDPNKVEVIPPGVAVTLPMFRLGDFSQQYSKAHLELLPRGNSGELLVYFKKIAPDAVETYDPNDGNGNPYPDSITETSGIYRFERFEPGYWYEMVLTNNNPYAVAVSISTYDESGNPKGMPYLGKAVLEILAEYVGLSRTYKVEIPVGSTVNTTSVGIRGNVASAESGATASASSTLAVGFSPDSVINGDRAGSNWGNGGGWADGTGGVYPDWLQIDFGTTRTISEVDVFTIQDNYSSPSEPTEAMTFTQYGLLDYRVQYDSGSGIWLTLPGAIVTGNNLVWRKFTFAPVETTAIRVYVSSGAAGYSRIAEVEAY